MAAKTATNPALMQSEVGRHMSKARVLSDGSATWKEGEFLRTDDGGLLYEATTGAALGVGVDALNYFALTDLDTATTGVDTNYRTVGVCHVDDIYEINELDGTVAATTIGNWYDLNVTSNICTVDISTSTNAVFQVVEPKWRRETLLNKSTDTLALMYVQILERSLHAAKV